MTETSNTYIYPVAANEIDTTVEMTTSGSHDGAYKGSVDFAVPLNSEVLAAADGKITRVCDNSNKYGETADFGSDVNYITIEHPNSELSEYLHLAKDSALVKVGDTVKSGQVIAKTGLSGWLFAPHLHFMVYKQVDKPEDFRCLEVRFR